MKGIVLAGGLGSRLQPLTKNENKHYLPVYTKRMIEYPIRTLVRAGIKDIILITGGNKPGEFLGLLKNGKQHGIERLYYTYQEGNGGIADALKLAEPFMEEGEDCAVILGDNYFEQDITIPDKVYGAHIFLKEVDEPWHFGIATISGDQIISIAEKPKTSESNLAILGCYLFDHHVWDLLERVKPSDRGELEITDLLKEYMGICTPEPYISHQFYNGYWSDMGTFESWMEVSNRVKKLCT